MKQSEIISRCIKELRSSKTLPMLVVAKRYCMLFYEQLKRDQVSETALQLFKEKIERTYKANKKRLE